MKFRVHWGFGLAAAYVLFATSTVGFVVFAIERPVDLVSPDYYAQSLRHDQRLAAMTNAAELGHELDVEVAYRNVRLHFPPAMAATIEGTATLYRPSSAAADRVMALRPNRDGVQMLSLARVPAGHWVLQLQWTAGGRAFYHEATVIVR
jgi:nitrogen fixation protein FixH